MHFLCSIERTGFLQLHPTTNTEDAKKRKKYCNYLLFIYIWLFEIYMFVIFWPFWGAPMTCVCTLARCHPVLMINATEFDWIEGLTSLLADEVYNMFASGNSRAGTKATLGLLSQVKSHGGWGVEPGGCPGAHCYHCLAVSSGNRKQHITTGCNVCTYWRAHVLV